jgi:hypothetical protein
MNEPNQWRVHVRKPGGPPEWAAYTSGEEAKEAANAVYDGTPAGTAVTLVPPGFLLMEGDERIVGVTGGGF